MSGVLLKKDVRKSISMQVVLLTGFCVLFNFNFVLQVCETVRVEWKQLDSLCRSIEIYFYLLVEHSLCSSKICICSWKYWRIHIFPSNLADSCLTVSFLFLFLFFGCFTFEGVTLFADEFPGNLCNVLMGCYFVPTKFH